MIACPIADCRFAPRFRSTPNAETSHKEGVEEQCTDGLSRHCLRLPLSLKERPSAPCHQNWVEADAMLIDMPSIMPWQGVVTEIWELSGYAWRLIRLLAMPEQYQRHGKSVYSYES